MYKDRFRSRGIFCAGKRKGATTDKERALTEREHHESEGNINVIHETFTLKNVRTGKVKVKDLRKIF